MVRILVLALIVAQYFYSYSQELGGLDSKKNKTSQIETYDPVIFFSATISPGKMIRNGLNTTYIHGFIEAKDKSKISYRGDAYQLISYTNHPNSSLNPNFLNRLMSGLFSHYHKKNIDVFIGLQGGLSFCNFLFDPLIGPYKWSYSPTLSIKSGFRFFVWKYANFFLETTYFHNYLNNTSFGSVNLNEIIVSGGLGLQIERPKKHKYSNIPGTPSF